MTDDTTDMEPAATRTDTEERDIVLQMLAEGKLTAAEAADLLDALEPAPRPAEPQPAYGSTVFPGSAGYSAPRPMSGIPLAHRLVIQVQEGEESRVNIRIPLGLTKVATRFVPKAAREQLERYEINLSNLLEGIAQGHPAGNLIDVHDGEDRIRIAIESDAQPPVPWPQ
jgi:hypothetical protein